MVIKQRSHKWGTTLYILYCLIRKLEAPHSPHHHFFHTGPGVFPLVNGDPWYFQWRCQNNGLTKQVTSMQSGLTHLTLECYPHNCSCWCHVCWYTAHFCRVHSNHIFFLAHPIQLKLGGIVKRAGSFGQIGEYGIVYGMGFTTWLPLSAGYSGDICPMSRSSKAGLVRCQAKSVSSLHFDCSMTQWLCYEDPVFFWRARLVGLPFFGW